MDLREFIDIVNQKAGSTEYGELMRNIDPNLNQDYEAAKNRNMRRKMDKFAKENEKRNKTIRIFKNFSSDHALPLQLASICAYDISEDITEDHQAILVCDESRYNGVNVVWRCDPEENEIMSIYKNIIDPNAVKNDMDWDTFKVYLTEVMTEDIWSLCKKGFHVTKENSDEEVNIKAKDALGMAHFVYCNYFKRSYNKCNGTGGSCFITTAVCEYFGKPDDCRELTILRNYRDKWLKNQPSGKKLIDEYYKIAPSIVSKMKDSDNYDEICEELFQKYISPCIELINQKKFDECKNLYIDMVKYANSMTDKR